MVIGPIKPPSPSPSPSLDALGPTPPPPAAGFAVTPDVLKRVANALRTDATGPDAPELKLPAKCPGADVWGCSEVADAAADYLTSHRGALSRLHADQVAMAGHLETNADHYHTREGYLADIFRPPGQAI